MTGLESGRVAADGVAIPPCTDVPPESYRLLAAAAAAIAAYAE